MWMKRLLTVCITTALILSITVSCSAASLNEILGGEPTLNIVTEKLTALVDYTVGKFKDTSKDAWYINSVSKLTGIGGIEGYPDGTFLPDGETTTAEFTKLLLAAMGCKQRVNTGSEWYSNYVVKAKELGAIEATDNYNYDGGMKRAGMAKMICKMLKIQPQKSDKSIFTDTSSVDTNWIDTAFQEYLIRGYYAQGKRTFAPEQTATRAEVSEMVVRALEYKQDPLLYKKEKETYFKEIEKKQDAADSNPQTPTSYINYEETLDLVSGFNPPADFVVPKMRVVHDDPGQASWFYIKLDNLLDYKNAGNYAVRATCTNVDLTNTYIDPNGDKKRLDGWKDPMVSINRKARAMMLWSASKVSYSDTWKPDSYSITLKDGDILDLEVRIKNDSFEQVYKKSITVHIPQEE